jgi:archaellum biogenesis protein FlaJ (TadC family)
MKIVKWIVVTAALTFDVFLYVLAVRYPSYFTAIPAAVALFGTYLYWVISAYRRRPPDTDWPGGPSADDGHNFPLMG